VTGRAEAEATRAFRAEGLESHTWSNGPGYLYPEHQHPYHKVLFCVAGSIDFQTPGGPAHLEPGDRLDLPARTSHSARVGPDGVTCMEAARHEG